MPFLRTETAPLRMIIRGEIKAWTVKPIEDLRTHESWIVAVFGSSPQDSDYWELDKARGRAIRHHLRPRVAMFTPREGRADIAREFESSSRTRSMDRHDRVHPSHSR